MDNLEKLAGKNGIHGKFRIERLCDGLFSAEKAARWFGEKWGIPVSEYRESISDCLENKAAVPQWYVAVENERIIGGAGVIENDFHERKDLRPNVCAVYTEPDRRGEGVAGAVLNFICADMKERGIGALYLVTELQTFYERYGWHFLCRARSDDGSLMRVYMREIIK